MNGGRGADSPRVTRCRVPRWNRLGDEAWHSQPRAVFRPPLEMRQPIVTPRGGEGRGNEPRMSAPSHGGGEVGAAAE